MLNPGSLHYAASWAISALHKFESSAKPDRAEAMLAGMALQWNINIFNDVLFNHLTAALGGGKHVPTGNDIMAVAWVTRHFVCFVESSSMEPL